LVPDLPTGVTDVLAGRVGFRGYLRSLRSVDAYAVLDREDWRPWIAELTLLPYLMVKRGF
jgi:hypothetical protein